MEALNYTIKKSNRARRVGLRISPRDGLVVTVPNGFNTQRIPHILHKKWNWIEQHENLIKQSEVLETEQSLIPDEIEVAALGIVYPVILRRTTAPTVKIMEQDETLIVYGAVTDKPRCIYALQGWLRQKANEELIPWLQDLCDDTGLVCDDVTIRNQKSRWGSCSGRKNISLNMKMLFLSPELVRYVLIHELCHTVHLNHSKRFWKLVERFDADYQEHDKALAHYWYGGVPAWVDYCQQR